MANNTNSNTTKTRSRTAKTAKPAAQAPAAVKEAEVITAPAVEEAPKKQLRAKDVDLGQYITVRNGFQGRLVYKSKRTGEKFVWDSFGAEQDMELGELKNAKNSSKKYFINNWFMFDEPWVVDFLGLGQYYKFAISIDDFDKLFEMTADEIGPVLEKMSDGQKRSVAYRARQLIAEGGIDSNRLIAALEKGLGTELVEK